MRRLKATSAPVISAILIFVLGATVYLFSAGIGSQRAVEWVGRRAGSQFLISPGEVRMDLAWFSPPRPFVYLPFEDRNEHQIEIGHSFFGFLLGYRQAELGGPLRVKIRRVIIAIPWWFVAFLALAPFLEPWKQRSIERWKERVRTRRSENREICPECGYDLRAAPDRCPECGRLAGNPTRSAR